MARLVDAMQMQTSEMRRKLVESMKQITFTG